MTQLQTKEEIRNLLKKYKIHFDEATHKYAYEGLTGPSVTGLLSHLHKRFDEKAMALRCSQNPNHSLYSLTPEEILLIWKQKNEVSKVRGSSTHDYAEACLWNDKERIKKALENKYLNYKLVAGFNFFKQTYLVPYDFEVVETECKIVFPEHCIFGTFDALLYFPKYGYFIFDWKTNEKWEDYSNYNLLPPFDFLDKSKWTEYTIQVYIYKYILQREYGIDIKGCRVVWLNEEQVISKKPKFEYDEKMIEKIIKVCKERYFNQK